MSALASWLTAALAMPAVADCGGEDWQGLRVIQDEHVRRVAIAVDGGSITHLDETWRVLGDEGGSGRASFRHCPNPELGRLELVSARVNGVEVLLSQSSGRPKLLSTAGGGTARLQSNADGRVSLDVDGLRAGDRLELHWRLAQAPLIPGQAFTAMVLDKPYPVRRSGFRVDTPVGMAPRYLAQGLDGPPARIVRADGESLIWEGGPRQAATSPGAAARITLSTAGDWETVRAWYRRHYLAAAEDGLPGLADLVTTRPDGRPDLAALLGTLRRVIRVGRAESGLNALLPVPAGQVLARGEGDCKDLAALLAGVLRRAGVQAWPVLWSPLDLAAEPPNPHVFAHAFLRVESAGGAYLLDPLSGAVHDPRDYFGHLLDLGPAPVGTGGIS